MHGFPWHWKRKVPRFDNAGMDGADPDLVNLDLRHAKEWISITLAQPAPSKRTA